MLYEKLGCIFRVFNDIVPQMNVHEQNIRVYVNNRPAELLLL